MKVSKFQERFKIITAFSKLLEKYLMLDYKFIEKYPFFQILSMVFEKNVNFTCIYRSWAGFMDNT